MTGEAIARVVDVGNGAIGVVVLGLSNGLLVDEPEVAFDIAFAVASVVFRR